MNTKHFALLCGLSALFGASYLFMRIGAHAFGPIPLIAVRLSVAALFLMAVLGLKQGFGNMRGRLLLLFINGIIALALPFCLFVYAELSLTAGVTAVIGATAPLWTALIAVIWLGERLTTARIVGSLISFAGVLILVWKDLQGLRSLSPSALAPLAALAASLLYGIGANFTKKFLTGVDAWTVTAGGALGGTLMLLPFAVKTWPTAAIPITAWAAALSLAIVCTGLAFVLYFYLIAVTGPTYAASVSFLSPIFGILWGRLFLNEPITFTMVAGCTIVVIGTMLASGVLKKNKLPKLSTSPL